MKNLTAIIAFSMFASATSTVALAQDGTDKVVPRMIAGNEQAMQRHQAETVAKKESASKPVAQTQAPTPAKKDADHSDEKS
jgi:type IV secretory pathway VirB6-like protein